MKRRTLFTIGLATVLASATQAYSQEQLAKSMQDVRVETTRTSEQLKTTVAALNALTAKTEGDLRPAFNTFASEVTNTVTAATTTAARVKWMDGDGQEYFKEWQTTIASISNESLRKTSTKRLEQVREDYNEVKKELNEATAKFKPLLSDLSDIQKALSTDMTAGGVKAIKSTVKSANSNHGSVEKAINSALKELEKMQKALSPEAK
jgi:hypothetical protein